MSRDRYRTKAALGWLFVLLCAIGTAAQTGPAPKGVKGTMKNVPVKLPAVTQVEDAGMKKLLQPNGKPLLVNFWATWCDPCREEYPDLVKLDAEYKGKIDFITISLDEPADISTTVPKFLYDMKAEMPAYLLKTADADSVIASVSKDWNGGMPFTILFNKTGETAYVRQGKVVLEKLRAELDKLTANPTSIR